MKDFTKASKLPRDYQAEENKQIAPHSHEFAQVTQIDEEVVTK